MNGKLTELFKFLSSMPDQIKSTVVDLLGCFLMKVYQQNSKRDISLDIFRMNQFSNCTSFNPRNLILSRKGLLEHTKRAALQGGWIWKECEFNVPNQCPTNWGWCRNVIDRNFLPKWQCNVDCDIIFDINNIIATCACGPGRCGSCKCSKHEMKCLQFCNCQRNCTNK